MIGRLIEIAEDGRYLHAERGFLVVQHKSVEKGRIPLDDIMAVIASGHGLVVSQELLVRLAERNAVFVLCSKRHEPVGVLWSVDGFHRQAARMDAQLASKLPLRKRLWQSLIKSKIAHQASLLDAWDLAPAGLLRLQAKVRSGDPDNIEAQAARRYWSTLFGSGFKRDREAEGANALLNYGYTVLRSATARFVVAAGLHPTVSLHHSNQLNPMRLVDDLIEPFRPFVDAAVRQLVSMDKLEVNAETKRHLAMLLYADHETARGTSPLIQSIERLCISLALVFLGERKELELPPPPTKLHWRGLIRVGADRDLAIGVPDHVDDGDV